MASSHNTRTARIAGMAACGRRCGRHASGHGVNTALAL